MNAQSPSPIPPPAPMKKEKILKEDGRFLYYYSFDETPQPITPRESELKREDADV